jgi:hypothetical protein
MRNSYFGEFVFSGFRGSKEENGNGTMAIVCKAHIK